MRSVSVGAAIVFIALVMLVPKSAVNSQVNTRTPQFEPSNTPKSQECHAEDAPIFHVRFSADGQYLVANWPPNSIRIWNAKTGNRVSTLSDAVFNRSEMFVISQDNKFLVTASYAGVPILWDMLSGKEIRVLSSPTGLNPIQSISSSPLANYVVITDIAHHLWNLSSESQPVEFSVVGEFGMSSALSADGRLLFTINDSKGSLPRMHIWDVKERKLLYTFERVHEGVFSPNGDYVLTQGGDGNKLWSTSQFNQISTLDPILRNWQFSPNGNYLLASEGQDAIVLLDALKGTLLHRFEIQTGIPIAAFFPDNMTVMFAQDFVDDSNPKTTYSIRDIRSGNELRQVTIGISIYRSHQFVLAPSGEFVVIGSTYGTVSSWDIQSGKEIQKYC
jgi:WD40 repeat protein